MNLQQFINFIKYPDKLNNKSISLLSDLTLEFPYCQTIHLLYAINLHKQNSIYYSNQLKIAAAYAIDRKKLKQLIYHTDIIDKTSDYVLESREHQTTKTNENLNELSKAKRKEQLIEKLTKEMEEIHAEKQKKEQEKHISHTKQKSQIELINKFIKKNPSISRPKAVFFNPDEIAHQSIINNNDIVSETLAKIYYKQGKFLKAIEIYKKLILEFPDKKFIFANRIENIKKEINK